MCLEFKALLCPALFAELQQVPVYKQFLAYIQCIVHHGYGIPMSKNKNNKLLETEVLETEITSPEAGVIEQTTRRGRLFASLGYRDYRYLWSGALLSNTGTWIQSVALGWYVLQITNSEFSLGIVNFASTIPTFFLALVGGVVADKYERRSLLIGTQVVLLLLAFSLGILASLNIASILSILGITLAAGVASSFSFPAWISFIPETVPKKDLLNAVALNSAQFNVARLIGPGIAGLLIGRLGTAAPFYINALSFLAVIFALTLIQPRPAKKRRISESAWDNFAGGIRYARENASVAVLLISIGIISVFGLSHSVLMPVFARDILNVGARGLGYLMAASGFGAVTGTLIVAGLSHIIPKRHLIRIGMLTFGIFLLVFAFSKIFILSLIAQIGIGVAFLTTNSSINTSLQLAAPPEIRGRVMSLFIWAFLGLSPFGSFAIGSMAKLIGSPLAVAINATILVVAAVVLFLRPNLLAGVE